MLEIEIPPFEPSTKKQDGFVPELKDVLPVSVLKFAELIVPFAVVVPFNL